VLIGVGRRRRVFVGMGVRIVLSGRGWLRWWRRVWRGVCGAAA